MSNDFGGTTDQPLPVPTEHAAYIAPALTATLPVGAFTASVLFDVLALVAETPEQGHTFRRRALDLLKVGVGASLATLALGLVEALKIPAAPGTDRETTVSLALEGTVAAIYLLDIASREKNAAGQPDSDGDAGSIGLSLAGLALLVAAGKARLPFGLGS